LSISDLKPLPKKNARKIKSASTIVTGMEAVMAVLVVDDLTATRVPRQRKIHVLRPPQKRIATITTTGTAVAISAVAVVIVTWAHHRHRIRDLLLQPTPIEVAAQEVHSAMIRDRLL